jgi:hypothetical protein
VWPVSVIEIQKALDDIAQMALAENDEVESTNPKGRHPCAFDPRDFRVSQPDETEQVEAHRYEWEPRRYQWTGTGSMSTKPCKTTGRAATTWPLALDDPLGCDHISMSGDLGLLWAVCLVAIARHVRRFRAEAGG